MILNIITVCAESTHADYKSTQKDKKLRHPLAAMPQSGLVHSDV